MSGPKQFCVVYVVPVICGLTVVVFIIPVDCDVPP